MAATLVTELQDLTKTIETLHTRLGEYNILMNRNEVLTFCRSAQRLSTAAQQLSGDIHSFTEACQRPPTNEGKSMLIKALGCFSGGQVNKMILRRDLALFFQGPDFSTLDSAQMTSRKRVVSRRCAALRGLHPRSCLLWACAFPPSAWTATSMSQDTFEYIVQELDPESGPDFPSELREILHLLGKEKPLDQYQEFGALVEAFEKRHLSLERQKYSEKDQNDLNNLSQGSNGGMVDQDIMFDSQQTSEAQSQHVVARQEYEHAPGFLTLPGDTYCSFVYTSRRMVENVPEPFRSGIMMSNQWNKEPKEGGLAVTKCLSLFMPKRVGEDVLVVVKVGYQRGWEICDAVAFGEGML